MNLDELRSNIDSVDDGLKKLFLSRMEIAHDIALIKAENGDEIYKPDREKAVIERLTADVDESLKAEYADFVANVIRISREYQAKLVEEKKNSND